MIKRRTSYCFQKFESKCGGVKSEQKELSVNGIEPWREFQRAASAGVASIPVRAIFRGWSFSSFFAERGSDDRRARRKEAVRLISPPS